MKLFRGQQWKTGSKVKPHLMPEHCPCARAGTVTAIHVENGEAVEFDQPLISIS